MSAAAPAAVIEAAAGYIARGWLVFILSPSKVPVALCDPCRADHLTGAQMEACRCLTCHGFYAATNDLDRLREMVRRHPGGLLAIRTGAVSGIAVADVDPPGRAAMRDLMMAGLLPRTLAVLTGRDGYHLYYAHPGARIMSGGGKFAPGIDSKADLGYVVAPPSVHPQTRQPYRWLSAFTDPLTPLPPYWADRLRPPSPAPAAAWTSPATLAGSYAGAALEAEARAVAGTTLNRNDRLNTAAFSLGQLVAAGALSLAEVTGALMGAAAACGLAADDGPGSCQATIRSGLRGGMANPRRCAA